MEKQHTPDKQKPVEHKQKIAPAPIAEKKETKIEEHKHESNEVKAEEKPVEHKREEEKEEKKKIAKKEFAFVYGKDLGISKKHSMAICDFIRGRNPEKMIQELERVIKLKKAIRMKGEIPHRKGGFPGRYPVNASKVFISLLKGLIGNASVNGIESPVITKAVPNDAARPFKRGGSMRFKRTNVYLEAREKVEKVNNKAEEKK